MATYTDQFGRVIDGLGEIKLDTAAIRESLTKSVVGPAQPYDAAKKKAATGETRVDYEKNIKNIGDSLVTIVGYKLDKEIEKLNGLIQKVSDNLEDTNKKKETARRTKTAPKVDSPSGKSNDVSEFASKLGAKIDRFLAKQINAKPIASGDIPKQPKAPDASAVKQDAQFKKLDTDMESLCHCICACLKSTSTAETSVLKTIAKAEKAAAKAAADAAKAAAAAVVNDPNKKKRTDYDMYHPELSDNEAKNSREARDKAQKDRVQSVREFGGKAANGIIAALRAEHPVEDALTPAAGKISELFGKGLATTIAAPFKIAAGIEIAGFKAEFLGPIGEMAGALFGAMADGFLKLVLHPLAEEVSYVSKTMNAEFITKGGVAGYSAESSVGLNKDNLPAGAGDEWSQIAKSIADYNAGLDGAIKRQEAWRVGVNDVAETGQRQSVIEKTQLDNYRKGINDQTKLRNLTRQSLAAATQIDASAESTSELFTDWTQKLSLSNNQIGSMSRALNSVVKSTGIFGDELVKIAQQSTIFMHNMQLAGSFTTQAGENIIKLLANAQKTGTSQGMQNLLEVLSKSIVSQDSPISNLARLGAAGPNGGPEVLQHLLAGDLATSTKSLRDFALNLKERGKQFVDAKPGQSFKDAVDQLDPVIRGIKSSLIKSNFGVEINEWALIIDNMIDSTKSFGENLTELNKKAAGALTEQEVRQRLGADWTKTIDDLQKKNKNELALTLQDLLKMKDLPPKLRDVFAGQIAVQQAKSQKDALFVDEGNKLLTDIGKSVEKGDSINAALNKAKGGDKGESYRQYLGAIGADKAGGADALQKILQDQATRLNKSADEAGLEGLKLKPEEIADAIAKAQKGGKGADQGIKDIVDRFRQFQNVLTEQASESKNPMRKVEQILFRLESFFKSKMYDAIVKIAPLIEGALQNLINQPFFKSLEKGNYADAAKQFGVFLQELGKGARDIFKQLIDLNKSGLADDMQTFLAGFNAMLGTLTEPITNFVGQIFEHVIPIVINGFTSAWESLTSKGNFEGFSKFLDDASKQIMSILTLDLKGWLESAQRAFDNVSKAIEAVMGFLSGENGLVTVLGVTLVGGLVALAAILGGPAGVIALTAGLVIGFSGLADSLLNLIGIGSKAEEEAARKQGKVPAAEARRHVQERENAMKESFNNFNKNFEPNKSNTSVLENNILKEAPQFRQEAENFDEYRKKNNDMLTELEKKNLEASAKRFRDQADTIEQKSRKAIEDSIKAEAKSNPIQVERDIRSKIRDRDTDLSPEKKALNEQIIAQEQAALKESKSNSLFESLKGQVKPEDWEKLRTATKMFAESASSFSKVEDITPELKKQLEDKIKTIKTENGQSIDLMDANKKLIDSTDILNNAREAARKLQATKTFFSEGLAKGGKDYGLNPDKARELQGFLKTKLDMKEEVGTEDFTKALKSADTSKLLEAIQGFIKENGETPGLAKLEQDLRINSQMKARADAKVEKLMPKKPDELVGPPAPKPEDIKPKEPEKPKEPVAPPKPEAKLPGGVPAVAPKGKPEANNLPLDANDKRIFKKRSIVDIVGGAINAVKGIFNPGEGNFDKGEGVVPNAADKGRARRTGELTPDAEALLRRMKPVDNLARGPRFGNLGNQIPPPFYIPPHGTFSRRQAGKHRYFVPTPAQMFPGQRRQRRRGAAAGGGGDFFAGLYDKFATPLVDAAKKFGGPLIEGLFGKPEEKKGFFEGLYDKFGVPVIDAAKKFGGPLIEGLFGKPEEKKGLVGGLIDDVTKPIVGTVDGIFGKGAFDNGLKAVGDFFGGGKPELFGPPEPKPELFGPPEPKPELFGPPEPKPELFGPPEPKPELFGPPEPKPELFGPPEPKPELFGPPEPPKEVVDINTSILNTLVDIKKILFDSTMMTKSMVNPTDIFKSTFGFSGNEFGDIFKNIQDSFGDNKPKRKFGEGWLGDPTAGFGDIFKNIIPIDDLKKDDNDISGRKDDLISPFIDKLGTITSMIPGFGSVIDEFKKQFVDMPKADDDKDKDIAKHSEKTAENTDQMIQLLGALVSILGSGNPAAKEALMNAKNLGPFLASIMPLDWAGANFFDSAGMNITQG